MRTPGRHRPPRARGSIAVECALLLPIFIMLLTVMLFAGRIFWHYTVAEKAAHDAARFLATASLKEMRTPGGGTEVPIVALAKRIVQEEIEELNPGGFVVPSILCYVGPAANPYWEECFGIDTPRKIRVRVTVAISDPILESATSWLNNGEPIVLRAVMATDYVGN